MVNFGLNAAAILGLFLAVAGAGLFFLRSIRPELARDYDIFFAAVGLLCGIILLFNGWRLDPILQFGQFLLTGTAVFFAFESIRMRGVATEQARRNTPTVDRDRPVSPNRVYTEAELDRIDPYDNVYEGAKPNYNSPRLRGYDDPQPRPTRRPPSRNRPAPDVDLRREPSRRRPVRNRPEPTDYTARAPQDDRYGYSNPDAPVRRPSTEPTNGYDDWDSPRTASRPRPRPRPNRDDIYSEPTPPTESIRRPGPADLGRSYEPENDYSTDNLGNSYDDRDLGRSYDEPSNEPKESIPGDYVVDYQPLDDSEIDRNYDDSNEYDDYENYDDGDYPVDDYPVDDYSQPTSRPPINLGNSNDYPRPTGDDRAL